MAALAGGAELVGGAALVAGFMTPLAAAVVIGTMLSAAVALHGRHGLWAIDNGYEYPLMIAAAAASLAFTGPGTLSLDAGLGLGAAGIASGLGTLALGLVAGSAMLISRAVVRSESRLPRQPPISRVPVLRVIRVDKRSPYL
jgi:putative oxidoreductase